MADEKIKKLTKNQLQRMYINGGIDEDKLREMLAENYPPSQIQPIIDEAKALKETAEVKNDEEKIKKRYISTFVVGETIFESVIMDVQPTFLGYNRKSGEWITKKEFPMGTDLYLPLKLDMVPYPHYFLNHAILKQLNGGGYKKTTAQIYDDILDEVNTFVSAKKDIKAVGIAFVMETYQQHKFEELGYPFLIGAIDSGKSRYLEIVKSLAYRAMFTTDLNDANVYNFIGIKDEGICTIIEDEAHSLNREKNIDKLAIYRAGYRKGSTVPRILDASSSARTQVFYKIFCSKMFGGYYMPYDKAFQQRCIPLHMVWGKPTKDKIEQEDKDRLRHKRFNLLIWRMRNYFNNLPDINIPNLSGRPREIWEAKLKSVIGTQGEDLIRNMIQGDLGTRIEDRKQSLEAHLTISLLTLPDEKITKVPFSTIYRNLLDILGEGDHAHENSYESEYLDRKISKKVVGLNFGSIFNGKRELVYGIGRVWSFDIDILNSLKEKYYINDDVMNDAKTALGVAELERSEEERGAREMFE